MTIFRNRSGTLYAGTGITLTCTVTLGSGVNYDGIAVSISWSGQERLLPATRYLVTDAVEEPGDRFSTSLTISPLAYQDSGTFNCAATVSGGKIISATGGSSYYLRICEY